MVYQTSAILKDVRICLDQNSSNNALLLDADTDTLMLDDIITSKITQAVDSVHLVAPNHLLETGHNLTSPIHWGNLESGWLLLPPDFLRLTSFQMSDWDTPVLSPLPPSHPSYHLQRSRIKALRGTPQRPACIISSRPEGKILEFFSCKTTSATITQATYIPQAHIDNNAGVDISKLCYNPVIYTIAAHTCFTLQQNDQANALLEIAKTTIAQ